MKLTKTLSKQVAILAILFAAGCASVPAEPEPPKPFILVAHRGVVEDGLTENSLESLEETIRRGYTHFEVDVRCTRDGHPVCLHDRDLRKVAGIDGNIDAMTLAELREKVPENTVPTFETFCARCEGRIGLMPDIKGCPGEVMDAYIEGIDRSMSEHGLIENALFIGSPVAARGFLGRSRLAWRMPLEKARERDEREPGKRYFVFNHAADFDQHEVDGFHELGLDVVVSINTQHYKDGDPVAQGNADVARMVELGVDGLQLDSVYEEAARKALALRRERNL